MFPFRKVFLLITLFLLICNYLVFSQERQSITGTSMSLVPPENFILSNQFKGFTNKNASATILVMKIPERPYVYIDEAVIKSDIQKKGAAIVNRESITIN